MSSNLLFPIDGFTLGKTTIDELVNLGIVELDDRYSLSNGLIDEIRGASLGDIFIQYGEKSRIIDYCSIMGDDDDSIPQKWISLGMSWENTPDEWLEFAETHNLETRCYSKKPDHRADEDDRDYSLCLSYSADGIFYDIYLDYSYYSDLMFSRLGRKRDEFLEFKSISVHARKQDKL